MISVVIPTLNAGVTLASCIKSIRDQETSPKEIIVVDGGSADDTQEVARAYADRVLIAEPNRSQQRNLGLHASTGSHVLFVDADMTLTPSVLTACEDSFVQDASLVALVIPEKSVGVTFWSRVKSFERSFYQGVWWMEARRCFVREAVIKAGGYDPKLLGGEDWDLDQRMRVYGRTGRITPVIFHHEQQLTLKRLRQKKSHYAETLKTYTDRHPSRAARQLRLVPRVSLFIRHPIRLLVHPVLTAGLVVMGSLEWSAQHWKSHDDPLYQERPL